MKKWFKYILYIIAVISLTTCKTPYTPAPITAVNNYLVVEGFINISDSTYINLSRTVGVMSASTVHPELKAIISIESNTGGSYPLSELGNGVYGGPNYNLSAANQYRVRIKTSNGNTYTSNFVQTSIAPPIDSVIWQAQGDGLHVSINTQDAKNSTKYFRWDYYETWEFYTFATSSAIYNGVTLVPRTPAQQNHHCWGYDSNASVLLASTATLSNQDIALNEPITFIPISSEKLSWEYSILVKQYALTTDAYEYWTLLKKNTEQLGSIFDAQPSASIGNLQNVNNPAEPVIGYISAGTVSQTRIFINRYTQLPQPYYVAYFDNDPYNQYSCNLDTGLPPASAIWGLKPEIIAATGTDGSGYEPPACADCTLRGSSTKPSYWP